MATDRFHEGERLLQERFGTRVPLAGRESALFAGRALTGGVAAFVRSLPLVALATRDGDGWPFPLLELGPWEIPAPHEIRLPRIRDADRLGSHLAGHPKVGTLAMHPQRRFRIRINGVGELRRDALRLRVEHAFGNCRKYLHVIRPAPAVTRPLAMEPWRTALDAHDAVVISGASHVFIATQDADGDLDAQYKGGIPGWLTLDDAGTVVWPDYPGNGYFMSLGNLQQDPRIGLLVPAGLVLQGRAEVVDDPAELARFPGAERTVRLHVTRVARAQDVAPGSQEVAAYSPTFEELGIAEGVGPIP